MYSDAYHNLGPTTNFPIDHSVSKSSKNDLISFENFTILFSFIGPLLSVIFLILIIPISKEYNSLTSWPEIHQFTNDYQSILINLMYLLAASNLFAFIGLMLGLVHKKIILIIFNFLSLTIAFGMFLPMMVMIIGD